MRIRNPLAPGEIATVKKCSSGLEAEIISGYGAEIFHEHNMSNRGGRLFATLCEPNSAASYAASFLGRFPTPHRGRARHKAECIGGE